MHLNTQLGVQKAATAQLFCLIKPGPKTGERNCPVETPPGVMDPALGSPTKGCGPVETGTEKGHENY